MTQKRLNSTTWILALFLASLLILLITAMYQIDRQLGKMATIQTTMNEQASDIRELRTSLNEFKRKLSDGSLAQNNGIAQSVTTTNTTSAFQRAKLASQQPDYAQGDWNINVFGNNLKTLTPIVSTDAYASDVQNYVLESLISRNPDTLEWEGLIAKAWQISPEGLTITFQLRDDVTFSDGKPVTADDVVFSYQFMMHPDIKAPGLKATYEPIKEVKATNPHEVVFTFKEPYFEALGLAGGLSILPKHFYEPYLKEPQKFNESKGILLGSGPYRLPNPTSWTPDQGIVELVRNERYWGEVQPSFNRILWKIIQNDSARLISYRNGEIDSYGARPSEYAKLKNDPQIKDKSQNFEYMPPVAGYTYIAWNQEKNGKPTIFSDRRVRQAMTHLTDVNRMIQDIFLGYADPAVSPFSDTSKQHDPNLKPYPISLETAQKLLKDAGFEDRNKDGVLEDKDGKPFEFKLTYFSQNEESKSMVLMLKDLYAKAGIKMTPNPQEWPVMLDALKKRDFDAITLGWTSGLETDIYQMFHSSQIKDQGDNFIHYTNPELDKLIDEARRTVQEPKRMPIWRQTEKIMYEDQPYTFLMRRKTLAFIDKRIHNLQMTKMGLNRGLLPIETYVPKDLQKYKQ